MLYTNKVIDFVLDESLKLKFENDILKLLKSYNIIKNSRGVTYIKIGMSCDESPKIYIEQVEADWLKDEKDAI
jgi:hypothetical protein